MLRKNNRGLVWYEFDLLQNQPVRHAVFTRKGGVSKSPYNTLNVGDGIGDCEKALTENKSRIQDLLKAERLVFLNQVHKDGVEVVTTGDEKLVADGMITAKKDLAIGIRHADCQAAIFYDPKNHVIANVHAGWRGNVQNIYEKALKRMKGSDPKDIIACISPSLGPDAAEFMNYESELPESFWKFKDERNHFNLWQIAKHQLLELGVPEAQIELASICTHKEEENFFSYRRDKQTGRNATVCLLI